MSRVFMGFAASGETLFEARCGAKDFFDKLKRKGYALPFFVCLCYNNKKPQRGFLQCRWNAQKRIWRKKDIWTA